MSLHFIFGRAGTGKTTRCCREIQDYLKKNPGNRAYLLVPIRAHTRRSTCSRNPSPVAASSM